MKLDPLGIYYLDYSDVSFPKSRRKMIIGYTRQDLLDKIAEAKIPDNWLCWFQECRTTGYLVEDNTASVVAWIDKHMPETFGEPLNG